MDLENIKDALNDYAVIAYPNLDHSFDMEGAAGYVAEELSETGSIPIDGAFLREALEMYAY